MSISCIKSDCKNDAAIASNYCDEHRAKKKDFVPDAKKHFVVSMVKSGLRIAAGVALFFGDYVHAGVLLVVAEIVGIIEELV